ncbi:MAG: hydrolase TatD [Chloroflexota bacterium]|nr:MAG: hydrolase TatD [Chloroflexota bacterium]
MFDTRSVEFFDSHCHLTAEQFDADRGAVIQRAVDAGVTRLLTLATDVTSSHAAIALAEKFDAVFCAVGIHPESVSKAELGDLRRLRELAAHPKVVAIGEIGLDFYWDKTTAEAQQKFFESQLELAAELALPVCIHDRDAHAKLLATLENFARATPRAARHARGALHAFSGDAAMAQRAFDLGYVVSFGGPITFKNNKTAPALLNALPLEKILIETDAPYLTPHPWRGKRNEPAYIKLVAQQIATARGLSVAQVAAQTTHNALELFRRQELRGRHGPERYSETD